MTLTGLEQEFLKRLSKQRWSSPPLFDHSLVARLVEAGYVETRALSTGSIEYEITDAGRVAMAETGLLSSSPGKSARARLGMLSEKE